MWRRPGAMLAAAQGALLLAGRGLPVVRAAFLVLTWHPCLFPSPRFALASGGATDSVLEFGRGTAVSVAAAGRVAAVPCGGQVGRCL